MVEAIASALERFGLHPIHLVAVLIGLLISWGLTQALKRWLGIHGGRARLLAFLIALLATYTCARTTPWALEGYAVLDFWLAAVTGLLAPTIYKLVIELARWKLPQLADALSGDSGNDPPNDPPNDLPRDPPP